MKKILALLIALTMISSFLPTVALAGGDEVVPPYVTMVQRDYDFDENAGPSSWPVADLKDDHGKILRHPEQSLASREVAFISSVPENAITVVETYIGIFEEGENYYLDNGGINFFYYTGTSGRKVCLARNDSGNFKFMGSDTDIPMNLGEWYKIRIEVPQGAGTATLDIVSDDGQGEEHQVQKASLFAGLTKGAFAASIATYGHNYSSEDNLTFYDDFKVTYLVPPYTVAAKAYDRTGTETALGNVDYIGSSIKLTFSQKMKSIAIEDDAVNALIDGDIKLFDEDGNEVAFSGTLDAATGKIYTILPQENLTPKANYKIVATDVFASSEVGYWNGEEVLPAFEIPFTVSKKDLSIEDVYSEVSGDTVSYDVTIRNKTGEDQTAYIVIARYDGEKCVAVTAKSVSGAVDGVVYEDITLKNLGTEDAIILIDADGSFRTEDIWGK